MKTITLTDKQFDSIFDFIDSKLEFVLEYEIDNPDILDEWADLFDAHEAFIENGDVSIREVTFGGDPIEDFVSYHPNIGASDDELTKICDDIYQTLMGAFVAQMMEIA